MVEGYPWEPQEARVPDIFGATGLVSTFRKVGFVEVFRHSESQPIMRYHV